MNIIFVVVLHAWNRKTKRPENFLIISYAMGCTASFLCPAFIPEMFHKFEIHGNSQML